MSNDIIKKEWADFIDNPKYKKYLISNKDIWYNKLEQLKTYIDKYNKTPSNKDTNSYIKTLGSWIYIQNQNYKKERDIMSDINIRIKWKDFIEDPKYKKYFISNIGEWKNKLEAVKKYINDNNIKPSCNDKNDKIKQLGNWISIQNDNYKKKNKYYEKYSYS